MSTEDALPDLDLVIARFPGTDTASEAFVAARDRAGADAPWVRKVGFVEHHHNGKLALRGMFGGHYVDVDEEDHVSDKGAAEGFAIGALVGLLGGPPGLAVGITLGTFIGAVLGPPTEVEPEPQELVDQLRAAVPRSSSAIVMIAPPPEAEEMLTALGDTGEVIRQKLAPEQVAALEASLRDAPA